MHIIFRIALILILKYIITLANGSNYRIVGGNSVRLGEFPYQASLRRSYNDHHFCGGTIVSPLHILTAAHCLVYSWGAILSPNTLSVFTAQITLQVSRHLVYRNASKIVVHENFSSEVMANDIGIVLLNRELPLEFHKLLKAIPLREYSINNGKCLVSGWGFPKHNVQSVSSTLLAAEVTIINFPECRSLYDKEGIELSEGMLCAGHERGETDACQGDSGGPLVCNGLLTGVISTGVGCGEATFPGIYTDVAKFSPWIKSQIQTGWDVTSFPIILNSKQQENHINDYLSMVTNGSIDETSDTVVLNIKENFNNTNSSLHHQSNSGKLKPILLTMFLVVFISL